MKAKHWLLVLFIFLSILFQVALRESFPFLHFEVFIIFVVILSFTTPYHEGLLWSFFAGFIQDLFAAGPGMGVYTFTALVISFMIKLFKDLLMLKSVTNLMILIFISTLAEMIITRFIYSLVFNVRSVIHGSLIIQLLMPSSLNAILAIPIYFLIQKIHKSSGRKIWLTR